jgi:hypothetical protein
MSRALDEDTLITLRDASEIVFNKQISVAVLKAQIAPGNLRVSKIGRSYFTTPRDVKEMVERCRVKAQGQNSGSTDCEIDGRSSTGSVELALASLQRSFTKPKGRSRNISQRNTSPPEATPIRR